MRKILLATTICSLLACCTFAVDLEEIQKLKDMGFTNEQIVEMTKASSANVAENKPALPNAEMIQQITNAKNNNKGLLIIVASKEYADQGPGKIHVFDGKQHLEDLPLQEYVSAGPNGIAKTSYTEYSKSKKWTWGDSTTVVANTICSRYLGSYELPAGNHEIKLERSLYIGDPTDALRFKARYHKIFHDVNIEVGKVTVINYYWEANEKFGKDVVNSANHKAIVNNVTSSWGEYLKK